MLRNEGIKRRKRGEGGEKGIESDKMEKGKYERRRG